MKKVTWYPNKVIYIFEKNEDIFQPNYFLFFLKQKQIELPFMLHVNEDWNSIAIFGNFGTNIHLKVNNINYIYDYIPNQETIVASDGKKKDPKITEIDDDIELSNEVYKLAINDEKIEVLPVEKDVTLPIRVHYFTNENFPDYPHKKQKFDNFLNLQRETNLIYKVIIENEEYIIKSNPRYYWSNVKDLKSFISDLHLELIDRTDKELFKLIQEKSMYLKKRFGLAEEHIEDIEYFPLYKRVVNLYCIENMISLSYINGNYISQGVENGNMSSLKLGNFAIGQDGGTTGQIFSPQAIKYMIENAEKELKDALIKRAGIAYQLKNEGCGCCVTNKIIRKKIQNFF